jgi:transposase
MLFIGIDISADSFAASIFANVNDSFISKDDFDNTPSGFDDFQSWLVEHGVVKQNCTLCMEATGVYGESLSYWLAANGYKIVVEHPLRVKKAFTSPSHKTDKIDSRKIAEYAFRYADQLKYWVPPDIIVEQIKVLLTAREQFIKEKTSNTNALKALMRKKVQTPLANKLHTQTIERLSKNIIRIEKELQKLIDSNDFYKETVKNLSATPGIALLLSANFLVMTNGFQNEMATNPKKASANLGICPLMHQSGTSVYKKPKSTKNGPKRMRKLLHLAARSNTVHNSSFCTYAAIKIAQGKPSRIIMNNISNKLLKIMCAIVRTGEPYVDNYVSKHPQIA